MSTGPSIPGRLRACLLAATVLVLAVPAAAQAPSVSQEELQRLLQERDAVIIELLRRVDALELRLMQVDELPPVAFERTFPVAEDGTPPVPAPRPSVRAPAEPPPAARPGAFEVDEDAAERALERTLVQEGALLLAAGQAEFTPSFAYTRTSVTAPIFVTDNGITSAGERELRRNLFEASVGLRVGLPWDAQIEAELPLRHVRESTVDRVAFQPQGRTRADGTGLGDLRIGLAKTLVRENGWVPDLIGRVAWDTSSGRRRDGGVVLGGGFHEFQAGLSAIKRLDPLVFVASGSYQTALRRGGVRPGDQYGLALGAFLAASPEASLRFVFEQTYLDETKVGGNRVAGSDGVASALSLGTSIVLAPRVLLDIAGTIGLTDEAADYGIRVSLPFRFETPFY